METAEKLKLAEFVENLESIRGRHTELVTVLIPAGYNVNAVVKQLEGEKSTATNIKSRQTRNNVIEALEKIIQDKKDAVTKSSVEDYNIASWPFYKADQVGYERALTEMLDILKIKDKVRP